MTEESSEHKLIDMCVHGNFPDSCQLCIAENSKPKEIEKEGETESIFELGKERMAQNRDSYLKTLQSIRQKRYLAQGMSEDQIRQAELEFTEQSSQLRQTIGEFRLVHRLSHTALQKLLEAKRLSSSRQIEGQTNTFEFDKKLRRDEGIFFSAGYGLMGQYYDTAALVMSKEQSQDVINNESTNNKCPGLV
ncbi:MAG: hypothetical protein WCO23_02260 [bacterium]